MAVKGFDSRAIVEAFFLPQERLAMRLLFFHNTVAV